MAFDMAWNFRNTSSYVSDPVYAVPFLGETFPHTYTNSNGNSLNAGLSVAGPARADRVATNDPRIAGLMYATPAEVITLTFDLGSGSAPGAGAYSIDGAFGDPIQSLTEEFQVLDNASTLIQLASPGTATGAANKFFDATVSIVTATTAWTGTPVTKTFTSATCKVIINQAADGNFVGISHFRLTLGGAATSFGSMGMLTLMGVGV